MGLTTALVAASVGMSAVGAAQQAKSRRQQAGYQRDVAETNAEIGRQNAQDVVERGRVAVYDQRRAVARQLSDIDAATAGSGLVVGEGGTTPAAMVEAMNEAGELDVMRLKNNIAREERRGLIQAQNYEAQAGQFDLQRRSISPLRSGLTAGLNAATQAGSMDILFSG